MLSLESLGNINVTEVIAGLNINEIGTQQIWTITVTALLSIISLIKAKAYKILPLLCTFFVTTVKQTIILINDKILRIFGIDVSITDTQVIESHFAYIRDDLNKIRLEIQSLKTIKKLNETIEQNVSG
ncbi:NSP4 [Rotavirus D chicken/05V0049/DEU/2005]|uniref:NSP4 n=1 Tax=Rotavirus D chicken/05V0049/DEU/2005 TaxID=884200 RepID=E2EBU8_9REOV|nr:NSP4 [Rotavirus D chicken/05V0049/DEU/2005]ADN06432.1 NSP4 [Rotavirus D chicken/05V0049/DEU/2005]